MLELKKSTILTGESHIDEDLVATYQANISLENSGNTSVFQNIMNQALYEANKVEMRKEMQEFQTKVWEIEDEFTENPERFSK